MIDGNTAAALGCVYAGATVGAWYPITPSTSLMDSFHGFCEKYRAWIRRPARTTSDRPGRGRAGRDRHRARRELEWRARVHADQRPGHLTHERVPRARLLRGSARRCSSTCSASARRPACRRARSRATSCCAHMHRMATRSICCCSRRILGNASSSRSSRFDLAERLQTPVFLVSDLDIGMNDWMCPESQMGRRLPPGSRQGARRRNSLKLEQASTATSTRTATASPIAHAARACTRKARFSRAAPGTSSTARTRKTRTNTSGSWTG